MHIQPDVVNPFNPDQPARGADLVGRAQEIQTIVEHLLKGEHVWIDGECGLGVTSLALEAASRLGAQTRTIALNLARPPRPDAAMDAVRQQGTGASPQDPTAKGFTRVVSDLVKPGPGGDAAGAGELLSGVLRVLEQLQARPAESRLVVVLEGLEKGRVLGAEAMGSALERMLAVRQPIVCILCTQGGLSAEQSHTLGAATERVRLGPVDSRAMADWIDERLARSGVPSHGAGESIVRLAGEKTRDRVDLASRTFDVAVKAGLANAATVEFAFKRVVNESAGKSEKTWKELTPEERGVLQAIAEGKGLAASSGRLPAQSSQPDAAKLKAAVEGLLAKGVISRETQGSLKIDSPALRGWVLKARLGLRRESVGRNRNLGFSFDLGLERKPGASRQQVI